MTLTEIEKALGNDLGEREAAVRNHEAYLQRVDAHIAELRRQRQMLMGGLDGEQIATAEALLEVRGLRNGRYDARCISKAIEDILRGCPHMRTQFFGSKDYAQWAYQECDCTYGCGPRHGSIVFSVGLKNPQAVLSESDVEACLYYLNALRDEGLRKAIIGERVSV